MPAMIRDAWTTTLPQPSGEVRSHHVGYEIKDGSITPDNQNIVTIKELQPPKNVKQRQRFLGSVNVYNKFIDSYAKIREPLNQLLKKDK
ncbi:transposon Tf2-11 polyprotein [Trichonephila clavipes]|nr:transposon Tf2-11 polyprotein [Trichonephila clavipes]